MILHGSEVISFTAGFGVAGNRTKGEETFDQLISRAGQALYRAKEGGRNRVVCYREDAENPIS